MKYLSFKNLKTFAVGMFLLAVVFMLSGCTFVGDTPMLNGKPDFLIGLWHGMVAPYTLIIRWFINIKMYSIVNTGFNYDLGFMIGILLSLPIGWLAAIISIVYFLT
jgi:hypothetical protein